MASLITPLSNTWKVYEKSKPIIEELEKAQQLNPDDNQGFYALQLIFAQWLLSFLPGPVGLINNTTTVADATIKDTALKVQQEKKYTEELIQGVHHILKKHNLTFDTTQDMKIIIDEDYIATIPKKTLKEFNMIQKFVTSAELVYKELTTPDTFDLFQTIQEKNDEFKKHSENVQNVRVDFVVEPESYLGEVVKEFEKNKKANEDLYKTPRKETTLSSTTASFETHSHTPSPQASCSNSGGKINFMILIPVVVVTIPLGGAGGASFCTIM